MNLVCSTNQVRISMYDDDVLYLVQQYRTQHAQLSPHSLCLSVKNDEEKDTLLFFKKSNQIINPFYPFYPCYASITSSALSNNCTSQSPLPVQRHRRRPPSKRHSPRRSIRTPVPRVHVRPPRHNQRMRQSPVQQPPIMVLPPLLQPEPMEARVQSVQQQNVRISFQNPFQNRND